MQKTKITWTDLSWNPVTGCLHNCSYCYAMSISTRFKRSFNPTFHNDRLAKPFSIKGNKKIFVGSMADVFGDWVPKKWIDNILEIVKKCPQHTFIFLTKNPKRMVNIDWPENAWIGASTTNKKQLDNARCLRDSNAVVKFISAEPLLEKITLRKTDKFDWIIIGAQTGIKKFQPKQSWVNSLSAGCREINAALFYKPNLDCFKSNQIEEFPQIAIKSKKEQCKLSL